MGLQIGLQERDDHIGHLFKRAWARQRFPSSSVTTKGGALAIAAKLGEARHYSGLLIVQTFDQQVASVSLRDDPRVTGQAGKFDAGIRPRNV
ncbi:hypothetical protein LMG29542_08675 [Paraburkholderia humisilvae]|uniref:Uncharacterized protein n=1 Tax=Paraburkholderia humisilvae TaxID=627669 RepID=A0A6J5FAC9_9BURK|nr:hypothetical protein LMG29542_08675 [Paraburkholderia humisilvae]